MAKGNNPVDTIGDALALAIDLLTVAACAYRAHFQAPDVATAVHAWFVDQCVEDITRLTAELPTEVSDARLWDVERTASGRARVRAVQVAA